MSRLPILPGLVSVSGFGIGCIAVIWFLTREPPSTEPHPPRAERLASSPRGQVASAPRAERVASRLEAAAATAAQEPLPTSNPAPSASPEPQPLLAQPIGGDARLEPAETAALEVEAGRTGSGEAAAQADVSESAFDPPASTREGVPGFEGGERVYAVELTGQSPARSTLDEGHRASRAEPADPASVVAAVAGTGDRRERVRARGRRLLDDLRMSR